MAGKLATATDPTLDCCLDDPGVGGLLPALGQIVKEGAVSEVSISVNSYIDNVNAFTDCLCILLVSVVLFKVLARYLCVNL